MVPRALQVAFEEDVEFRKALPIDYLNYMGVAFSDVVSRAIEKWKRLKIISPLKNDNSFL